MTIDISLVGLEKCRYARCAPAKRKILGRFHPNDKSAPPRVQGALAVARFAQTFARNGKPFVKVTVTQWDTYSPRQQRKVCSRCLLRPQGEKNCHGYFSNYPSITPFKEGMTEIARHIERHFKELRPEYEYDYYFLKRRQTPWMKLLEFMAVVRDRPKPKHMPWDKVVDIGFQLMKELEKEGVLEKVEVAAPGTPFTEESFPIADALLNHFVFREDPLSKKEINWLIPVAATFVEACKDYYDSRLRYDEDPDPDHIETVHVFFAIMKRYLTMLEIADKAGLRIEMLG